jgi:ketosteroid isomerase-like protein
MSQENVELVRAALDAASRGDLDALIGALDPAIEWTHVESDPDYAVHRGHDDVRAWLDEWAEVFPDMRWETERFLDAGGELVIALGRLCGRAGASGADVGSLVYGIIFTVRSGKIVRVEETDREAAVEAVGLEHRDDAATREVGDWLRSGYQRGSRDKAPPADWWHPDGEYVNAREDPDHATYRGLEAITKLFASWYEAYPDIEVVPLEVCVVGERVYAWTRYSGHAASTGLAIDIGDVAGEDLRGTGPSRVRTSSRDVQVRAHHGYSEVPLLPQSYGYSRSPTALRASSPDW